jgi:hypothetical protein
MMNYPREILPNPFHKLIGCNVNTNTLIRYTNTANLQELIEPSTGKIKVEHIISPKENMADLSTSLFCIFKLEYLKIHLTREGLTKYSHYCLPNIKVVKPKRNVHYNINNNRSHWWITIGLIHNQTVDFIQNGNRFTAQCHVVHTPMKWNYWHFSIRWHIAGIGYWNEMDESTPDGKKFKKKIGDKLGHESRVFVKMLSETGQPAEVELPKACYRLSTKEIFLYYFAWVRSLF